MIKMLRYKYATFVRLRTTESWSFSLPISFSPSPSSLKLTLSVSLLILLLAGMSPSAHAVQSSGQLMDSIVQNQSTDFYDDQAIQILKESRLKKYQNLTSTFNETAYQELKERLEAPLIKRNAEIVAEITKKFDKFTSAALGTLANITENDLLGLNFTIKKLEPASRSAIDEFPRDFMSDKFRRKGGFIVHIIIFVYLSLVLAVICDNYFLKSLEYISDALSLPADIAGATFMAIGTSAPELFTSVIGVFISDNDIGTGTIVGSAVFNLIAIPGACGFAAFYNLKVMPKISSFPIIRDTIFYMLTIITLILCIKDNQVDWVESIILLGMYVVYIIIMYFNAQVSQMIYKNSKRSSRDYMYSTGSGTSTLEDKLARKVAKLSSSKSSSKSTSCCCQQQTPPMELSGSELEYNEAVEQSRLLSAKQNHRISPPPAYQANGQTFHHHHTKVPHHPQSAVHQAVIPSAPLEVPDQAIDYSKIQLTPGENGKFKEVNSPTSNESTSPEPDLDYDAIHKALDANGHGIRANKAYDLERNLNSNGKMITSNKMVPRKANGDGGAYERLLGSDDDDDVESDWADNIIIKVLLFPFSVLFCFTLPKPSKFCFVLTFMSSILWIAALTYLIVWMVTLVGDSLGIPDTVSGITILAAGTSIPELISSYLIVKKAGLADMAICNSIGSNIFDILFCLGLPWLLKSFVNIVTKGLSFATLAAASIPIESTALPFTSVTLLLTIGAMLVIFKITNWRLSLQTGIYCTVVYVIFVVSSTMLELHV